LNAGRGTRFRCDFETILLFLILIVMLDLAFPVGEHDDEDEDEHEHDEETMSGGKFSTRLAFKMFSPQLMRARWTI
jgi:hypothetical protein